MGTARQQAKKLRLTNADERGGAVLCQRHLFIGTRTGRIQERSGNDSRMLGWCRYKLF